jgi:hypothetical protein
MLLVAGLLLRVSFVKGLRLPLGTVDWVSTVSYLATRWPKAH